MTKLPRIVMILLIVGVGMIFTSCGDNETFNVPVQVAPETPGAVLVNLPKTSMVNEIPSRMYEETWVIFMDVEFEPYGWIDKIDHKSHMIEYGTDGGNWFCAILFSETIIAPVLITGYDWWEPEDLKPEFQKANLQVLRTN